MSAPAAEIGQIAPTFTLTDLHNQPLRLADVRGKVVVVDFWASWCAPCVRTLPWLDGMVDRYGSQGFTVIAINLDKKRADADRLLARLPLKLPLAFDAAGATAAIYQMKVMPTSYLVGPDGIIRAIHPGFRESEIPLREAEIKNLLTVEGH